ncbi:hypothetical protein CRG98_000455 [Punica granatum]|uniref:Uncharacterized protein n=1 Tax=Punica granatum TaxID=22663 RepID=A0A2I0LER4_PUNGR|nr:hypothetical protein CRG98_000455 [Punica granatum]
MATEAEFVEPVSTMEYSSGKVEQIMNEFSLEELKKSRAVPHQPPEATEIAVKLGSEDIGCKTEDTVRHACEGHGRTLEGESFSESHPSAKVNVEGNEAENKMLTPEKQLENDGPDEAIQKAGGEEEKFEEEVSRKSCIKDTTETILLAKIDEAKVKVIEGDNAYQETSTEEFAMVIGKEVSALEMSAEDIEPERPDQEYGERNPGESEGANTGASLVHSPNETKSLSESNEMKDAKPVEDEIDCKSEPAGLIEPEVQTPLELQNSDTIATGFSPVDESNVDYHQEEANDSNSNRSVVLDFHAVEKHEEGFTEQSKLDIKKPEGCIHSVTEELRDAEATLPIKEETPTLSKVDVAEEIESPLSMETKIGDEYEASKSTEIAAAAHPSAEKDPPAADEAAVEKLVEEKEATVQKETRAEKESMSGEDVDSVIAGKPSDEKNLLLIEEVDQLNNGQNDTEAKRLDEIMCIESKERISEENGAAVSKGIQIGADESEEVPVPEKEYLPLIQEAGELNSGVDGMETDKMIDISSFKTEELVEEKREVHEAKETQAEDKTDASGSTEIAFAGHSSTDQQNLLQSHTEEEIEAINVEAEKLDEISDSEPKEQENGYSEAPKTQKIQAKEEFKTPKDSEGMISEHSSTEKEQETNQGVAGDKDTKEPMIEETSSAEELGVLQSGTDVANSSKEAPEEHTGIQAKEDSLALAEQYEVTHSEEDVQADASKETAAEPNLPLPVDVSRLLDEEAAQEEPLRRNPANFEEVASPKDEVGTINEVSEAKSQDRSTDTPIEEIDARKEETSKSDEGAENVSLTMDDVVEEKTKECGSDEPLTAASDKHAEMILEKPSTEVSQDSLTVTQEKPVLINTESVVEVQEVQEVDRSEMTEEIPMQMDETHTVAAENSATVSEQAELGEDVCIETQIQSKEHIHKDVETWMKNEAMDMTNHCKTDATEQSDENSSNQKVQMDVNEYDKACEEALDNTESLPTSLETEKIVLEESLDSKIPDGESREDYKLENITIDLKLDAGVGEEVIDPADVGKEISCADESRIAYNANTSTDQECIPSEMSSTEIKEQKESTSENEQHETAIKLTQERDDTEEAAEDEKEMKLQREDNLESSLAAVEREEKCSEEEDMQTNGAPKSEVEAPESPEGTTKVEDEANVHGHEGTMKPEIHEHDSETSQEAISEAEAGEVPAEFGDATKQVTSEEITITSEPKKQSEKTNGANDSIDEKVSCEEDDNAEILMRNATTHINDQGKSDETKVSYQNSLDQDVQMDNSECEKVRDEASEKSESLFVSSETDKISLEESSASKNPNEELEEDNKPEYAPLDSISGGDVIEKVTDPVDAGEKIRRASGPAPEDQSYEALSGTKEDMSQKSDESRIADDANKVIDLECIPNDMSGEEKKEKMESPSETERCGNIDEPTEAIELTKEYDDTENEKAVEDDKELKIQRDVNLESFLVAEVREEKCLDEEAAQTDGAPKSEIQEKDSETVSAVISETEARDHSTVLEGAKNQPTSEELAISSELEKQCEKTSEVNDPIVEKVLSEEVDDGEEKSHGCESSKEQVINEVANSEDILAPSPVESITVEEGDSGLGSECTEVKVENVHAEEITTGRSECESTSEDFETEKIQEHGSFLIPQTEDAGEEVSSNSMCQQSVPEREKLEKEEAAVDVSHIEYGETKAGPEEVCSSKHPETEAVDAVEETIEEEKSKTTASAGEIDGTSREVDVSDSQFPESVSGEEITSGRSCELEAQILTPGPVIVPENEENETAAVVEDTNEENETGEEMQQHTSPELSSAAEKRQGDGEVDGDVDGSESTKRMIREDSISEKRHCSMASTDIDEAAAHGEQTKVLENKGVSTSVSELSTKEEQDIQEEHDEQKVVSEEQAADMVEDIKEKAVTESVVQENESLELSSAVDVKKEGCIVKDNQNADSAAANEAAEDTTHEEGEHQSAPVEDLKVEPSETESSTEYAESPATAEKSAATSNTTDLSQQNDKMTQEATSEIQMEEKFQGSVDSGSWSLNAEEVTIEADKQHEIIIDEKHRFDEEVNVRESMKQVIEEDRFPEKRYCSTTSTENDEAAAHGEQAKEVLENKGIPTEQDIPEEHDEQKVISKEKYATESVVQESESLVSSSAADVKKEAAEDIPHEEHDVRSAPVEALKVEPLETESGKEYAESPATIGESTETSGAADLSPERAEMTQAATSEIQMEDEFSGSVDSESRNLNVEQATIEADKQRENIIDEKHHGDGEVDGRESIKHVIKEDSVPEQSGTTVEVIKEEDVTDSILQENESLKLSSSAEVTKEDCIEKDKQVEDIVSAATEATEDTRHEEDEDRSAPVEAQKLDTLEKESETENADSTIEKSLELIVETETISDLMSQRSEDDGKHGKSHDSEGEEDTKATREISRGNLKTSEEGDFGIVPAQNYSVTESFPILAEKNIDEERNIASDVLANVAEECVEQVVPEKIETSYDESNAANMAMEATDVNSGEAEHDQTEKESAHEILAVAQDIEVKSMISDVARSDADRNNHSDNALEAESDNILYEEENGAFRRADESASIKEEVMEKGRTMEESNAACKAVESGKNREDTKVPEDVKKEILEEADSRWEKIDSAAPEISPLEAQEDEKPEKGSNIDLEQGSQETESSTEYTESPATAEKVAETSNATDLSQENDKMTQETTSEIQMEDKFLGSVNSGSWNLNVEEVTIEADKQHEIIIDEKHRFDEEVNVRESIKQVIEEDNVPEKRQCSTTSTENDEAAVHGEQAKEVLENKGIPTEQDIPEEHDEQRVISEEQAWNIVEDIKEKDLTESVVQESESLVLSSAADVKKEECIDKDDQSVDAVTANEAAEGTRHEERDDRSAPVEALKVEPSETKSGKEHAESPATIGESAETSDATDLSPERAEMTQAATAEIQMEEEFLGSVDSESRDLNVEQVTIEADKQHKNIIDEKRACSTTSTENDEAAVHGEQAKEVLENKGIPTEQDIPEEHDEQRVISEEQAWNIVEDIKEKDLTESVVQESESLVLSSAADVKNEECIDKDDQTVDAATANEAAEDTPHEERDNRSAPVEALKKHHGDGEIDGRESIKQVIEEDSVPETKDCSSVSAEYDEAAVHNEPTKEEILESKGVSASTSELSIKEEQDISKEHDEEKVVSVEQSGTIVEDIKEEDVTDSILQENESLQLSSSTEVTKEDCIEKDKQVEDIVSAATEATEDTQHEEDEDRSGPVEALKLDTLEKRSEVTENVKAENQTEENTLGPKDSEIRSSISEDETVEVGKQDENAIEADGVIQDKISDEKDDGEHGKNHDSEGGEDTKATREISSGNLKTSEEGDFGIVPAQDYSVTEDTGEVCQLSVPEQEKLEKEEAATDVSNNEYEEAKAGPEEVCSSKHLETEAVDAVEETIEEEKSKTTASTGEIEGTSWEMDVSDSQFPESVSGEETTSGRSRELEAQILTPGPIIVPEIETAAVVEDTNEENETGEEMQQNTSLELSSAAEKRLGDGEVDGDVDVSESTKQMIQEDSISEKRHCSTMSTEIDEATAHGEQTEVLENKGFSTSTVDLKKEECIVKDNQNADSAAAREAPEDTPHEEGEDWSAPVEDLKVEPSETESGTGYAESPATTEKSAETSNATDLSEENDKMTQEATSEIQMEEKFPGSVDSESRNLNIEEVTIEADKQHEIIIEKKHRFDEEVSVSESMKQVIEEDSVPETDVKNEECIDKDDQTVDAATANEAAEDTPHEERDNRSAPVEALKKHHGDGEVDGRESIKQVIEEDSVLETKDCSSVSAEYDEAAVHDEPTKEEILENKGVSESTSELSIKEERDISKEHGEEKVVSMEQSGTTAEDIEEEDVTDSILQENESLQLSSSAERSEVTENVEAENQTEENTLGPKDSEIRSSISEEETVEVGKQDENAIEAEGVIQDKISDEKDDGDHGRNHDSEGGEDTKATNEISRGKLNTSEEGDFGIVPAQNYSVTESSPILAEKKIDDENNIASDVLANDAEECVEEVVPEKIETSYDDSNAANMAMEATDVNSGEAEHDQTVKESAHEILAVAQDIEVKSMISDAARSDADPNNHSDNALESKRDNILYEEENGAFRRADESASIKEEVMEKGCTMEESNAARKNREDTKVPEDVKKEILEEADSRWEKIDPAAPEISLPEAQEDEKPVEQSNIDLEQGSQETAKPEITQYQSAEEIEGTQMASGRAKTSINPVEATYVIEETTVEDTDVAVSKFVTEGIPGEVSLLDSSDRREVRAPVSALPLEAADMDTTTITEEIEETMKEVEQKHNKNLELTSAESALDVKIHEVSAKPEDAEVKERHFEVTTGNSVDVEESKKIMKVDEISLDMASTEEKQEPVEPCPVAEEITEETRQENELKDEEVKEEETETLKSTVHELQNQDVKDRALDEARAQNEADRLFVEIQEVKKSFPKEEEGNTAHEEVAELNTKNEKSEINFGKCLPTESTSSKEEELAAQGKADENPSIEEEVINKSVIAEEIHASCQERETSSVPAEVIAAKYLNEQTKAGNPEAEANPVSKSESSTTQVVENDESRKEQISIPMEETEEVKDVEKEIPEEADPHCKNIGPAVPEIGSLEAQWDEKPVEQSYNDLEQESQETAETKARLGDEEIEEALSKQIASAEEFRGIEMPSESVNGSTDSVEAPVTTIKGTTAENMNVAGSKLESRGIPEEVSVPESSDTKRVELRHNENLELTSVTEVMEEVDFQKAEEVSARATQSVSTLEVHEVFAQLEDTEINEKHFEVETGNSAVEEQTEKVIKANDISPDIAFGEEEQESDEPHPVAQGITDEIHRDNILKEEEVKDEEMKALKTIVHELQYQEDVKDHVLVEGRARDATDLVFVEEHESKKSSAHDEEGNPVHEEVAELNVTNSKNSSTKATTLKKEEKNVFQEGALAHKEFGDIHEESKQEEDRISAVTQEGANPSESSPCEMMATVVQTGKVDALQKADETVAKTLEKPEESILVHENPLDQHGGEEVTRTLGRKACEEPASTDMAAVSPSDPLKDPSATENLQVAMPMHFVETRDAMDSSLEMPSEGAKKDEEKDEANEDKHRRPSPEQDTPVMVESSKDIEVKGHHKKSHNILSGVGSRVKHSISKVKKAITGKSSHSKLQSPKQSS